MGIPESVERTLENLPARPGVYLMRDAEGRVLYVGKAVNLHSRVRSYFTPSAQENPKIRRLVSQIADLEFIVTDNELEALILEANLIKTHRPRFNVRLRDDKRYPYIVVTWAEPYPRVMLTRRVERDGNRYFGPFTSSSAVRETLDLLRRTFPYRTCGREITGKDARACLYYDLKLCPAPCIGAVNQEEYRAGIARLIRFLEGHGEEILEDLERRMREAAERLEFERAAILRDQWRAARQLMERQKIVAAIGSDQDVIAFARSDGDACVQVFFIRDGKLLGREYFLLEGAEAEEDREVLTAFLKQFYEEAAYIPQEVLLPEEIEEARVIEEWLRSRRGSKVILRVPRRGRGRDLVRMAAENAAQMLATLRAQWQADSHRQEQALEDLRVALGLPNRPARIEGYDISTTQGAEPTASMVVFEQGVPRKSEYRRFALRTLTGTDDYAGMREVLTRRLERWRTVTSGEMAGVRGVKAWAILPDLILVDGGKGQLNVALEVLESFGLRDRIAVAALAKEEEALFIPEREEPVRLPMDSAGLSLLRRLRDEAHRFALSYHRLRRERAGMASELENIPGVGPARRRALLRAFGSLERIRSATVEEIASVPGIPRSVAEAVKRYLG
ncbi:MAG: excinuclease ABC subunit UvrC [Anaerolineae bacterium]|nr:excinuclease ABC subunit UvrC [Anaerolineae bacterium]MCX8068733.1 excinuclease ABC subunit UvrC [Anaerolineae bacterium]MDW7992523.1 excinuclease ABC subunit UvrC [Anaerolineae bacterium]